MKKLIIGIFIMAFGITAQAASREVRYCNQTVEQIKFAFVHGWIGAPDPVFGSSSGYSTSKGWFDVAPNQCETITYNLKGWNSSDSISIFAKGNRGTVWQGSDNNVGFCIGTAVGAGEDFKFESRENSHFSTCQQAGGKWVLAKRTGFSDFTFTGGDRNSYLNICNNRTDGESFDFVYASFINNQWTSKGWWPMAPGQCRNLNLGTLQGDIYINGRFANGNVYLGTATGNFCVQSPGPFSIPFADSAPCNTAGHYKLTMFKIVIHPGNNSFAFAGP